MDRENLGLDSLIAELSQKALGESDIDLWIKEVMSGLTGQLRAERAGIWLRREVGSSWIRNDEGEPVPIKKPPFKLIAAGGDVGIGDLILRDRMSLQDVSNGEEVDSGVFLLDPHILIGSKSWEVLVLLRGLLDVEGLLFLGPRTGGDGHYGAREMRVLAAVGMWLGTYIGSRRVLDERRELETTQNLQLARAEQALRRRVSEELHDNVLAQLAAVRSYITLSKLHLENRDLTLSRLDQAEETLDEADEMIRALLDNHLTPPGIEKGLAIALEELRLRQEALDDPIEVEVENLGEVQRLLQGIYGDQLFQIIREAVTNAKKHGGKVRVKVVVRSGVGGLEVLVIDDGPGFDMNAVKSSSRGHGLENMKARAGRLRGICDIQSAPGSGTVVQVKIGREEVSRELGEALIDIKADDAKRIGVG